MTANDVGSEDPHVLRETRLVLIEEHGRQENQHDLEGILATCGAEAWYDDEPWNERYEDRDSVRQ